MENMDKSQTMQSMEKAVDSAVKYFAEMMKTSGMRVSNVRLEEIVKSDDSRHWNITLSYVDATSAGPFAEIYGAKDAERVNKLIEVDASSFEAVSMKNR